MTPSAHRQFTFPYSVAVSVLVIHLYFLSGSLSLARVSQPSYSNKVMLDYQIFFWTVLITDRFAIGLFFGTFNTKGHRLRDTQRQILFPRPFLCITFQEDFSDEISSCPRETRMRFDLHPRVERARQPRRTMEYPWVSRFARYSSLVSKTLVEFSTVVVALNTRRSARERGLCRWSKSGRDSFTIASNVTIVVIRRPPTRRVRIR